MRILRLQNPRISGFLIARESTSQSTPPSPRLHIFLQTRTVTPRLLKPSGRVRVSQSQPFPSSGVFLVSSYTPLCNQHGLDVMLLPTPSQRV